jgi:PAS domain S-box-containing protein
MAVGAIGLAGWILGVPAFKTVFPGLVTMKVNTAICLILLGAALLLLEKEPPLPVPRRMAQGLAAFVVLVGLLSFYEHIFGWDLRIDQLLFHESFEEAGQSFPGRMGPAACLSFMLLGSALLLLDYKTPRGLWLSPYLASASFSTTMLGFLSYFYGVQPISSLTQYSSIALHTVIAFLALCAGILLARPTREFMPSLMGARAGDVLARRLLPAALVLPAFLGWLAVLGRKANLYGPHYGTALVVTILTTVFSFLVWFTARSVNRSDVERARGEEALRRTVEFDNAVMANMGEGLYTVDRDGCVTFMNPAAEKLLGWTFEELRGRKMHDMTHHHRPDGTPFPAEECAGFQVLKQGKTLTAHEDVFIRKDGVFFDVVYSSAPIREGCDIAGLVVVFRDVTTRKRTEQDLLVHRQLLETTFTALPASVALVRGSDFAFELVNPAYQAIAPGKVMVGKTIYEVWPEAMPLFGERCRQVLETGEPFSEVDEHYRVSRSIGGPLESAYFTWSLRRVNLPGGKNPGLLITVWETTERKKAQEALRESEQRFRTLSDNIAQLAWMADEQGSIFWYNQRWFDYSGTTLEEMYGWGWQKIHHPSHVERVTAKFKHHIEMGQFWEDTFPLRRHDGVYRWFLSRAFPITDSQGRVTRWFGTNTDVTELREIQEALQERETVLRTVTNEARVGLVMVSQDRRYLFANNAYAEILGLPSADIVGKRVPDVLAGVYDQIRPRLDRAFSGERVEYELRMPAHPSTGAERFYEVVYEPRIENVAEPYVVVVLVDITERKKIQENLERVVAERTAQLRETVGELEAYSYSVTHDMRAPLRAMTAYTQALIEDFGEQLPPPARGYLNKIFSASNRMDQLITDVLAYSRVSRSQRALEPIDVEKLILEISQQYESLHQPQCEILLDGPVPLVMGEQASLSQCMSNILLNAVKFVAPGVKPRIRIWCEESKNLGATGPEQIRTTPDAAESPYVRLWFEDNGIGIDKKDMHRIFGIFERIHSSNTYEGTGIGLAIVKKAVERMGGQVGVESVLGKGSRFWLELKKATT